MNTFFRIVSTVATLLLYSASWADPVPVDCPPHCTVDPCKIAPERCKDKGGPLNQTAIPAATDKADVKVQEPDDPCKWCTPCSPTPGSQCLKCCAGHSKTLSRKSVR